MITPQMSTVQDTRERARKAITEYLVMFLPGSWAEPLARLKLILQSNSDIDWEAVKGYALHFFDEKRLAQDRVESLARIERFADAFKDLHKVLSLCIRSNSKGCHFDKKQDYHSGILQVDVWKK